MVCSKRGRRCIAQRPQNLIVTYAASHVSSGIVLKVLKLVHVQVAHSHAQKKKSVHEVFGPFNY